MMKIILLFIVLLGIQFSVYAAKPLKVEVSGNIKEFGDGKLYIHRQIPNNLQWFSDTIVIKGGKFCFLPDVEQPIMTDFLFKSDDGQRRIVMAVILDAGKIRISGNALSPKDMKVTGSETLRAFQELKGCFHNFIEMQDSITRGIVKIPPTQALERARWFDEEQRLMVDWKEALIQKEKLWASPAMPYFLYCYFDKRNLVYLSELLLLLPEKQKQDIYCRSLQERLEASVKSGVGTLAPDFLLYDVKGEAYRLSDYKGHYVLLDFSASWCSWCKKEIPYLREAYEVGKDKGLVIFTINMDTERNRWEDDVEKLGLPWETIGDLKGFKGNIAADYNVSGIPQIMLIDPQGRIVARDLRGNGMVKKVSDLPGIRK